MGGSPAPPRPSGGRKRLHAPACSTAPRYSRARARVCQLPDTATATAFLALVDGLQPGRTRQDELHAATRDEARIGQLPEEEADRLPRSADQRPDLLACQRQSDRDALTIPVAVLQPDSQAEPRQAAACAANPCDRSLEGSFRDRRWLWLEIVGFCEQRRAEHFSAADGSSSSRHDTPRKGDLSVGYTTSPNRGQSTPAWRDSGGRVAHCCGPGRPERRDLGAALIVDRRPWRSSSPLERHSAEQGPQRALCPATHRTVG